MRRSTKTYAVVEDFSEALDKLVAQIQQDRSILAAILCGSLSHDTVWKKSDIDLALVTIDDKKVPSSGIALNASGVNVHALLVPRAEFRTMVEASVRNSFMHSFLAKGRLLYTHDSTIADLCAKLQDLGERDTQIQLLSAATETLGSLDKARKWFTTRGDLDYTALWLLYAATPLARMEVYSARLLAGREVIQQAMKLNPEFFEIIYTNLLNTRKTRKNVEGALLAAEQYVADRAPRAFQLVLEYLREVGETRSSTELEAHFKRNFNWNGATAACEYLSNQGLISKVSAPVQLTKKSNVMVEELAFVYLEDILGAAPDEF